MNVHSSVPESVTCFKASHQVYHLHASHSLHISVLASSLKLEYPLSDALPNTNNSRDRLLAKIFQYRKSVASILSPPFEAQEEGRDVTSVVAAQDEDYEMLYAYTLVTGQLAEEIKKVEKEVEDLFGVIDEDLFELQ
jgi:hypothetical protein